MRAYIITILLLLNSFILWVQNSSAVLHNSFEKIKLQNISKALDIATQEWQVAKKNSSEEVDALIDIGLCHYYKDQYTEGETYLNRAVSIGNKIDYPKGIALAEYHLGALTILEGRYAESVIHLNKANELFTSLNDDNGKALCLNSLGEIFMFQGSYSKAESSFLNSLNLGNRNTEGDSYILLSQLYFRKNLFDKSYDQAKKAYSSGLKNMDLYVQASALDLIGACELKKGSIDRALINLRKSVGIKEYLTDKQGVASTFIELGKLKLSVNQKDSAYFFLRKAYGLSNGIGAKEEIKRSSILLSRIFASENRFDSAYLFQEKFVTINTALLQDNAAKRIDEIASKSKERDHQNSIRLYKKQQEVDRKNKLTILLIGLLIILFLAGLIIIQLNRYRLKQKNIKRLEKWNKFQETLLDISSKYINVTEDKISKSINELLAFTGEFMKVDRVYIMEYDTQNSVSSLTHEWCVAGVAEVVKTIQKIPFASTPGWVNLHFENKDMFVENLELYENGTLKLLLESTGIKSHLTVPMFSNGICIGFVGFDTVNSLKEFSKDERHLTKVFAEMLVNLFERSKYIETIENAKADIERYNIYLKEMVESETQKNIELTKSIADQEKLVTIGEISAGIAHDLNTPLGSTQIGLESIDYTVKKLFEEAIPNLLNEEILEIFSIAEKRDMELFQSTLKVRDEIQKLKIVLQQRFSISVEEADSLSKLFVECQIKDNEIELIDRILSISKRKYGLNLLFLLMNLKNLINSSMISAKRAAEVVGNLKTFIKNPENDHLKEINLFNSLQSVLSIFNHEIRNKVILEFDVGQTLKIHGYEVKLFQLWSNLIKNALEAMQDSLDKKLFIRSYQDPDYIKIEFSNSGEMIPIEMKEKIFDKFFSTKTHKSGTGLGLSIVKTIIEEHNAFLTFESNENLTTFVVAFKK